jgi:3-methyladenine DNA glycosylase/8-oxoguanine DNA glycosylase
MTRLELSARPPFRFLSVIRSHGWYQLAPYRWDAAAQVFQTIERLESGRVVVLEISGSAEGVSVSVAGRLAKQERAEVIGKVRWMFNLDADFTEFYMLADREPRLAHCRPNAHGRLLRSSSIFDDIVKVMLTTNIQWSGTKRLASALVNYFGEAVEGDTNRKAFPTAARLARTRETTLRALGLGYRAPYLLQLARGVASGHINLTSLLDTARSTDEVRRDLLRLPGIGPYAAATLLGILGRYDYIGVDTEAVSAVSRGFYGGRPVSEKEVNAVFEKWGRFKALAYWFWDWDGQGQSPMEAWEAKGAAANDTAART